jgi:hypothetical protein
MRLGSGVEVDKAKFPLAYSKPFESGGIGLAASASRVMGPSIRYIPLVRIDLKQK